MIRKISKIFIFFQQYPREPSRSMRTLVSILHLKYFGFVNLPTYSGWKYIFLKNDSTVVGSNTSSNGELFRLVFRLAGTS